MTPEDQALDRASKHSAYATVALAGVTTVALFGGLPFMFPLVAIPLWAAGLIQRLTEKPWFAAAAAAWGLGVAVLWSSPAVGVAALVPAGLAVRHWLVLRRVRPSGTLPAP